MADVYVRESKFLSLVLRHDPGSIGIVLGDGGWTDFDALVEKSAAAGMTLTRAMVDEILASSKKVRFAFSEDGKQIRALQGHSVGVDLQLQPVQPPAVLFHGTAQKNMQSILADGLKPGKRDYVHLSEDMWTAREVGARHGNPVIVPVPSGLMSKEGHKFFKADNGVWLVKAVPPQYLRPEKK